MTFDIDANGILNVSAKDKATGKSQNIVIKASSGLSDDEIDKMVTDAESHAEEDRKFRELVDTRNQADGLIHAAEKTLEEAGEKASSEERMAIENAVSDLKTALAGDDKETIDAKTAALGEASGSLAQKLYAEQAADGAGDAAMRMAHRLRTMLLMRSLRKWTKTISLSPGKSRISKML